MSSSKDEFLEKRAERLILLDNSVKLCKQNRLSPSVDLLEEAVKIGYELLEEVHRNNVQGRLAELVETVTKLAERFEQEKGIDE